MIETDLAVWHKKHPRASKWYPDWYVDFTPEGALTDSLDCRYSWKSCMNLVGQRDGWRCRVCGSKGIQKTKYGHTIEIHHIIPKKLGGADHPLNLITLCNICHQKTFRNNYSGIPNITFDPEENKNHKIDEFYNLVY